MPKISIFHAALKTQYYKQNDTLTTEIEKMKLKLPVFDVTSFTEPYTVVISYNPKSLFSLLFDTPGECICTDIVNINNPVQIFPLMYCII